MRTARAVSVAGSLLILASCSSSTNGSGSGSGTGAYGNGNTGTGSTGNTGTGATGNTGTGATGNTGTGATAATGATGTGSTGSTECLVGNACSTTGAYCVNGNITCTCINGAWGLCTNSSGAGGTGSGTGGTTATACSYGNSCSTVGSTCINGTYGCTCGTNLIWQSCTTLTGGTTSAGTGGTTSTGVGGTPTGAGGLPDGACAETYGEAQLKPPIIEILVDNTMSMSDTATSTNGQTKMACTRQALAAAFPRMPASYAVGMTYYHVRTGPCNDGVQAVPIAPMTAAQVTALTNSINNQAQIQMTPSEDAWRYASNYLLTFNGLPANYATSNRYIVVLTDGVPTLGQNCADTAGCNQGVSAAQYQTYIDTVAAGYANGLQTYVIGVPGSEATDQVTCNGVLQYDPLTKLSQVATAGGTAPAGCSDTGPNYCHIDLTNPNIDFVTELTNALGMITSTVASCQYEVPVPSNPNLQVNMNQIEVRYYAAGGATFELLPRNDGCPTTLGWQFTDATNTGIVFCADTCTTVQADPQARIEIYFGCLGEA
jgi:hypothetical protein